jgi:hypothetical protein
MEIGHAGRTMGGIYLLEGKWWGANGYSKRKLEQMVKSNISRLVWWHNRLYSKVW